MNSISFRLRIFLLALLAAALACDISVPTPAPSPFPTVAVPTLDPQVTLEPTAPLAPQELATPTPFTASGPPGPEFGDNECVPSVASASFTASQFADIPEAGLQFLNAGRTPGELFQALQSSGLVAAAPVIANADFSGDGRNDLALSVHNVQAAGLGPAGIMLIYLCQDNGFSNAYQRTPDDLMRGPYLYIAQDLDADGAGELVVSTENCGAHTCFERFEVLDWDGEAFLNKLVGFSDDLPYPTVQVTDYDLDGLFSVEIVGSGFGSVGAGPQRSHTRVWDYNAGQRNWQVSDEFLGPSNYRLHVLHDADGALYRGELDVAVGLYRLVAEDPNLAAWSDPSFEQATLAAFARYRMVTIFAIREDTNQVRALMNTMITTYTEDTPQFDYTNMALLFLSILEGGLDAACAAVENFAFNNAETVLDPLGEAYWGYGNPSYQPADMCPVAPGS